MSWWSVSPRIGVTTQPGVKVHRFERSTMRLMQLFWNCVFMLQFWRCKSYYEMKCHKKTTKSSVLNLSSSNMETVCRLCHGSPPKYTQSNYPKTWFCNPCHSGPHRLQYEILDAFLFLLSFTRGICALFILISKACILKIFKCPDAAHAWTALARPKHFEPFIGRSTNSISVYLLHLPACSKYQSNIFNLFL